MSLKLLSKGCLWETEPSGSRQQVADVIGVDVKNIYKHLPAS